MTYGQLKFRLTKAFPGVDADLIEGWITDCYQEILGQLPWSRLDVEAVLVTTAPYAAGTVAVTNGSQAVTLTGGTWTSGMSGLGFRITGDDDEYQFTFVSSTTGTLDRGYVGTTAAGAGYSIYQDVYPLPADCRFVDQGAFDRFPGGRLRRLAGEWGQGDFSAGHALGAPRLWWPYMDDGSTSPQMQVRLYPVPDQVYGIPFTYCAESTSPGSTGVTLLPWLQPAALIEGSTAKIKRHLKDYPGAATATTAYNVAVAIMRSEEGYRRGPLQMQLGSYYTAHRRGR